MPCFFVQSRAGMGEKTVSVYELIYIQTVTLFLYFNVQNEHIETHWESGSQRFRQKDGARDGTTVCTA